MVKLQKLAPVEKKSSLKHLQTLYRLPTEGGIILQNSYNV